MRFKISFLGTLMNIDINELCHLVKTETDELIEADKASYVARAISKVAHAYLEGLEESEQDEAKNQLDVLETLMGSNQNTLGYKLVDYLRKCIVMGYDNPDLMKSICTETMLHEQKEILDRLDNIEDDVKFISLEMTRATSSLIDNDTSIVTLDNKLNGLIEAIGKKGLL